MKCSGKSSDTAPQVLSTQMTCKSLSTGNLQLKTLLVVGALVAFDRPDLHWKCPGARGSFHWTRGGSQSCAGSVFLKQNPHTMPWFYIFYSYVQEFLAAFEKEGAATKRTSPAAYGCSGRWEGRRRQWKWDCLSAKVSPSEKLNVDFDTCGRMFHLSWAVGSVGAPAWWGSTVSTNSH